MSVFLFHYYYSTLYCTFFLSASCSLSWLLLPGLMVDLSFSSPVASTDRPSVRFSSASMAVVRGFTGWGLDGTTTKQHAHEQSNFIQQHLCGCFSFIWETFRRWKDFIRLPNWRSKTLKLYKWLETNIYLPAMDNKSQICVWIYYIYIYFPETHQRGSVGMVCARSDFSE